eukprot:CAMPEP_0182532180 /NCGR_PEP_ID=MMETSP1323-20130603/10998_1 /TAXON_ID=236787 /ORGANISM="Florenciella parvula, Strain RCC1693" /LENGTH=122 /DNA_ID=CAMNT_0024741877 /DNA_START=39 /DNA_END=407 /DNA_ORIENTATION=+
MGLYATNGGAVLVRCFSLPVLELLSHEFTLREALPPLVLRAVGIVKQLHYTQPDLLTALLQVCFEPFAFGHALRRRAHAPEAPRRVTRDCERFDCQLVEALRGFRLRTHALELFQARSEVKR